MSSSKIPKESLIIGHEYPQPDEEQTAKYTVKLLQDQMMKMYDDKKIKQLRQIHPKMNGCVKAEFIVEANLPEELKVGLFKEAACYPAWLRFSNGSTHPLPDWKKDIRGFAIKLMNVPGEKLIGKGSQDFILMNTKDFPSDSVKKFADVLFVVTTPFKFSTLFKKIKIFFSNIPIVVRGKIKAPIKMKNPAEIPYFSTVPYRFGDESQAVKYAVFPSKNNQLLNTGSKGKDLIRENLVLTLLNHELVFDFCVQFQSHPVKMPIEDPTVIWNSDFEKVATIRIPIQTFDTPEQNNFGDNLSFNVWHSLPEHRPIGNFNRVRKIIYEDMYEFRHKHNIMEDIEPEADDTFFNNTSINTTMEKTPTNEEVIMQMYKDFAEKNIPAVLALFDKDVVWERAGAPDIPFAGKFSGTQEMLKMFAITNDSIEVKSFVPVKFVSSGDTVVVLGHDEADVKPTGKTYKTEWVQAFTFKDQKIIHVQVYLDSLNIAKAFQP
jgi:ketosteroid isomerase-like protein